MNNCRRILGILVAAGTLVTARLVAGEAGPVAIHGALSTTASYADDWDFQGASAGSLSLNRVDLTLNGVHRFGNGLRVGAQVYAYRFAGYDEVTLDWANLDYSWTEAFGLRLGRNKIPIGLYNEVLDLDSVRVFANLPLSYYPRTQRAVTNASDNIMAYGRIVLGRAGGIEYEALFGRQENISAENPLVRGTNGLLQAGTWKFDAPVYGGSLIWSTPVEGLRFSYTYYEIESGGAACTLGYRNQLLPSQLGQPDLVDSILGAGTWDQSGLFAGTSAWIADNATTFRTASVEFSRGDLVLTAEYKLQDRFGGTTTIPALARIGQATTTPFVDIRWEFYYLQATYQVTKQIGVGAYYLHELRDRNSAGSSSDPKKYLHDYAVAVSYAPNDWFVVKLEAHRMVGLTRLNFEGAKNIFTADSDKDWNFFVFQTVFSF